MTARCRPAEPIHPTVHIDLTALKKNLYRVKQLAPKARIMAVVKANAYGHGMIEVAKALFSTDGFARAKPSGFARAKPDGFAVARLSEAIALRKGGIRSPILVLQGFSSPEELRDFADHDLWPTLHTETQCASLLESRPPLSGLWLKVDTGMHRLGLPPETFRNTYRRLARLYSEERIVLMTHLACADERGHPLTEMQLERFRRLTADLPSPKSFANSAAILQGLHGESCWVRPGLMLYGVSPFPKTTGQAFGLQPVMTLKSWIIATKTVEAGQTVGYGACWAAPRRARLGVVSIGYGDGYPREVQPGAPALIRGRRVPIVGRVAMDLITVDLTDMPDVGTGDEVVLWGEGLPVEEIAESAGTIPYTLLCGVTQRVKTHHHG